jgi:nucleoside-diphosphate-sugar epimerase
MAAPWGPREQFILHNVTATQRLLDAATRAGTVRRFIHVSSPSIYFRQRDQFDIGERFSPPATWPTWYGESKWLGECEVTRPEYRHLQPVILRPRAVFGPGDNAIAPRLLAAAQRGYFPLVSGGRALIDVTCIDNVVDAVELALRAPNSLAGQAFNITNGAPLSVGALVREWFDALGVRVRYVGLPRGLGSSLAALSEWLARRRPGQPEPRITRYGLGLLSYSQTLSIDAARRELGYTPRLSTSAGIAQHASWHARQT